MASDLATAVLDRILSDFHNFLDNRRWRTSVLAPFSGHIFLSLSNCGAEYFVRAYLQEVPIPILNCPTDCPWVVFKHNLESMLEYCPDVPYCAGSSGLRVGIGTLILLVLNTIISYHLWVFNIKIISCSVVLYEYLVANKHFNL